MPATPPPPADDLLPGSPSPDPSSASPSDGDLSDDARKPLSAARSDPTSEMSSRFNFFFRWFARRYFSHFDLDDATVASLRELETRGSVIYVMRYASRLDYFLFNTLFAREGLRLSRFANGLSFYPFRPFFQALRIALFRPRGRPREIKHSEDQEHARELARSDASFFLFLRTARLRSFLRGRRGKQRQDELDLLEVVTRSVWESEREVFLVPVSVFWRKGPRSESRFLNLSYGSLTRPSDISKVTSFFATYRRLTVKCGQAIDLRAFIDAHEEEGEARVARKVRRSILAYLYREEKVVEGPTLRPTHRIQEEVLAAPRISAAVRERAAGSRGSVERSWADAEKMFHEISAKMNSTFLAVLSAAVSAITRRMFASVEVKGLDRVAEYAKRHPLIIAPSHRSYFDFLLVSWLFYQNFLVPPHIAARENMAFGPFGFVFRRAGAFFLRKSFDDPLYKEVFRAYVSYLVREGFTQEFFIEGGRSRTGKTLAPRLGILSWNIEAFLDSTQRDLFIVPVSITYERLVEESSMIDELEGGEKTEESVRGLVRARKYLQNRFGSVHVCFGEPISVAEELGDARERIASGDDADGKEKREFVERLGLRIVERINRGAVANATSVAAAVLMGTAHRGLRRADLAERMQQLVDLLRLQGVQLTQALERDQGDFNVAISFLLRSDLVRSEKGDADEILYFDESRRRALDLYRNAVGQFLVTPSLLARKLLHGSSRADLEADLAAWHDILYQEFFIPTEDDAAEETLRYFESQSWIDWSGDFITPTPRGVPVLRFLAEQTRGILEAYQAVCRAASDPELDLDRAALLANAKQDFDRAVLLGEARRIESANDTCFSNALDLLVRRQILVFHEVAAPPAKGRGGKAKRAARTESRIAPGENAEALTELLERLSASLSPH